MDFSQIVKHMNNPHTVEIISLCKKYENLEEVGQTRLESLSFEGLNLICNGKSLRVNFPKKATAQTISQTIIDLGPNLEPQSHPPSTQEEIKIFLQEFNSAILGTTDGNLPLTSYAPIVEVDNKYYIYISSMADHYSNIQSNPNQITVLFLEDENKAKSIFIRRRLRYEARAHFIERDSEVFKKVLDEFESKIGGESKILRKFRDFSLIELQFGIGRFVRGFGEAYDIYPDGRILHVSGNPYQNPK